MIITVLGARPQFVKAAVLSAAFIRAGIDEEIIHTGQHYDAKMSDVFFDELGIPGVAKNLSIGSGNHGTQTGEMLIEIEKYVVSREKKTKAILVYGDTNSTLAGAIVAAKLHIPVIHVEAGLRSFNKKMPEEINRIMTDHISSLLFCSSDEGKTQLEKEGIVENVFVVGDIMYDAVLSFSSKARKPDDVNLHTVLEGKYNLVTVHRPANTDDKQTLQEILNGIGDIKDCCIWPVHPRNKKMLDTLNIPSNLILTEPLSYFEILYVLTNCHKVITDSGGLQKEAYWLKKPCITIRPQTEWLETLENNWNQLCEGSSDNLKKCYQIDPTKDSWTTLYGLGNSADKIVSTILNTL